MLMRGPERIERLCRKGSFDALSGKGSFDALRPTRTVERRPEVRGRQRNHRTPKAVTLLCRRWGHGDGVGLSASHLSCGGTSRVTSSMVTLGHSPQDMHSPPSPSPSVLEGVRDEFL